MTPDEIEARLRTGEDSRTELKSARPLPDADDLGKEIVAFANSGGGDLLLGISDDGAIEGVGSVKDAERIQRTIVQLCADRITPPIRLRTFVVEVRGELVVVARVPGFLPDRPFRGRSKYFVRDGNVSREARPDELRRALVSGGTLSFDEQPAEGSSLEDLDSAALDELLARVAPHAEPHGRSRILRDLKITSDDGVPTYAGLLMFARDPQAFLIDAYVSIVRLAGTRFGDPKRDAKEVRGTVTRQLEETADYLRLHVEGAVSTAGVERVEHAVPVEVWRELVANALAHRDYQIPSQTRVFVFDDRVEIANPGTLLNRLTMDGIRLGGISQRRNPHLAALIARARGRESWGLGIPRVLQLIEEAGLPVPELRIESGEFRVVV
ncbi:MAG: putative DNA binding domain-containing protein, partial [Sandaracinaceae bacterium]|nr:putative DNA binding domain-containing protein [Sandaracinaceae bacterium]